MKRKIAEKLMAERTARKRAFLCSEYQNRLICKEFGLDENCVVGFSEPQTNFYIQVLLKIHELFLENDSEKFQNFGKNQRILPYEQIAKAIYGAEYDSHLLHVQMAAVHLARSLGFVVGFTGRRECVCDYAPVFSRGAGTAGETEGIIAGNVFFAQTAKFFENGETIAKFYLDYCEYN